jgi:hypothetical protein
LISKKYFFTAMPATRPQKKLTKKQEAERKEMIKEKAAATRRRTKEEKQRQALDEEEAAVEEERQTVPDKDALQNQMAMLQGQMAAMVRKEKREEKLRFQLEAQRKNREAFEEEERMAEEERLSVKDTGILQSQVATLQGQVDAMVRRDKKESKKRKAAVIDVSESEEDSEEDTDSSSDDEVVTTRPKKRRQAAHAVQGHLHQITGKEATNEFYGEEEDDMSQSILLTNKEKETVINKGYLDFHKFFKRDQKNPLTAIQDRSVSTAADEMPMCVWARLWLAFMAEHILHYPEEAFQLCRYMDFVTKLEMDGADWRTYDATCRSFRGDRVARGLSTKKWSEINQILYWKALHQKEQPIQAVVRQEVQNAKPTYKPKAAPAAAVAPKSYPGIPDDKKFGVCWAYQYGRGCNDGSKCVYAHTHSCETCKEQHTTRFCSQTTNHIKPQVSVAESKSHGRKVSKRAEG